MRVVLPLVCAAQFMVVLDVSVMNVALPAIQDSLAFDARHLPWVGNAYALTFAGFLLLGGRLADLYGRNRMFVTGLALFTAAGLAGGLAGSAAVLIAARAAQGLGAAILAPVTLTILTTTYAEGPRRTKALAVWTAVSLAGGTAGNLIGGALTQYAGWRWILLINVPIGLVALGVALGAARLIGRHARTRTGDRLDVPGAVLATGGLAALAYGLNGPVGFVVAGVIMVALFAVVEARFARSPLIPPRLVRRRPIWLGNLVMLLAGACLNPMWYFLTLSMQQVLGYGPLETGLGFLPHTVLTMLVGLRLTPWLMRRANDRVLVVTGALIAAAGFLWQSRIAPGDPYLTAILGPAIAISVGGGLLNTPLTTTVTSGADPGDAGAASGLMNTTKQIGGALGLAALVTLAPGTTGTPQAPAAGYRTAFLATSAILATAAVLSLALPPRRDAEADERTPRR